MPTSLVFHSLYADVLGRFIAILAIAERTCAYIPPLLDDPRINLWFYALWEVRVHCKL